MEAMLPSLQQFDVDHADPYLQARNRPALSICSSGVTKPPEVGPSTSGRLPLHRFELLLAPDLCQARIGGRNGSFACTIIAALCVRDMLQSAAAGALQLSIPDLCDATTKGNAVYDNLKTTDLLSVEEVLALEPSWVFSFVKNRSFARRVLLSKQ